MSLPASQTDRGRLEVICGCMFAGKTAHLIARLLEARAAGFAVLAFKHALDIRYSPAALATHDHRRFEALPVRDVATIRAKAAGVRVVGIDEGQFFGEEIVTLCRDLRAAGKRVIVAGIDFNAWGCPFEPMPRLKEIAERVDVCCMPCTACGRPARYTQRIVPVESDDMVGGPGEYEPRCERCFVPLPGFPRNEPDGRA